MTLTKQTITDKIETVKIQDYYCIQVRQRKQILEDGVEISSSFNRYMLTPDADVSSISDPVVLAQFNAIMTQEVKDNYATYLASRNEELSEQE